MDKENVLVYTVSKAKEKNRLLTISQKCSFHNATKSIQHYFCSDVLVLGYLVLAEQVQRNSYLHQYSSQKLRIPTSSNSREFRSVLYCQESHEKTSYNNKATYTPAQQEKMYFVEIPGQWHDHKGLLLQLCPVTEPPLSELSWGETITQQGEQPPWSRIIPSRLQNQPEQDEQVKHEGNSTELYRTSLSTRVEILV